MLAIRVALSDPAKSADRAVWLEAHKAYLRSAHIKILQSGPFKVPEGQLAGALIVAAVDSLDDLARFSADDPFVTAGVYCEVRIAEWNVTLGAAP
jgi:uncharacterized protein YciI